MYVINYILPHKLLIVYKLMLKITELFRKNVAFIEYCCDVLQIISNRFARCRHRSAK